MSFAANGGGHVSPRLNEYLVGHEAAEHRLLDAFGSGRMPHGWLITGPRGIGKATLACRFARFVFAHAQRGSDPSPSAPKDLYVGPDESVFRRVASGGHLDLLMLERRVDEKGRLRTVITVDEARKVASFLRMTPGEGGWRVVIVDPVDDMNINAANAILKILEEPPASALLILVGHNPRRLLPTIRSRCCHLKLAPLPAATVAQLLDRYAPGHLPAGERTALTYLADGSIGRALDLAAGGGLGLYREIVKLLSGLPRLDSVALHDLGDRVARSTDWSLFRTTTELLSWWLARMIRCGADGRAPTEVMAGERDLMARLLGLRNLADWLELWENVTGIFAEAEKLNLDRKQVVLVAFLQIEALANRSRLGGEFGWRSPDGYRLP